MGLIYEDKQRARSRAYVRVGEPIEMDSDLATNPAVPPDETDREAVAALTSRSRRGSPMPRSTSRARSSAPLCVSRPTSRSDGSTAILEGDRPWERSNGWPTGSRRRRLTSRRTSARPPPSTARRSHAQRPRCRRHAGSGGGPRSQEPDRLAPDSGARAVRRDRTPRQCTTGDRGVRGRSPADAAGDPRDGEVPDCDRAVPGELGRAQVGRVRHRLPPLAPHARRRAGLRRRRAVVRRKGDPGAAGAAGSQETGRRVRPRGGPPRPPRPPRARRPSCDRDRERRRRRAGSWEDSAGSLDLQP